MLRNYRVNLDDLCSMHFSKHHILRGLDAWVSTAAPAAYLENREGGGGPRAGRAPLHPRRAPYGRHWRDFSEECFGPEGALRRPQGLIVVGGRLRTPSNYIFPVKTFAIGGRQTIVKGAFGAQGGPWPSGPHAYAPGYNCFTYLLY